MCEFIIFSSYSQNSAETSILFSYGLLRIHWNALVLLTMLHENVLRNRDVYQVRLIHHIHSNIATKQNPNPNKMISNYHLNTGTRNTKPKQCIDESMKKETAKSRHSIVRMVLEKMFWLYYNEWASQNKYTGSHVYSPNTYLYALQMLQGEKKRDV